MRGKSSRSTGPSGPPVFEFSLSPTGAPESCVIGAGAARAVVDNSPITQSIGNTRMMRSLLIRISCRWASRKHGTSAAGPHGYTQSPGSEWLTENFDGRDRSSRWHWHQHRKENADQQRRIDKYGTMLLTGAATMDADASSAR